MAYDGRFTSIKPIIEAVYRDAGIEEINFETALEDTAELIGLLGIPHAYVDKNTNGTDAPILQVIDYRAYLPTDLAYLIAIQKITLNGNNQIIRSEEMIEDPSIFFYDRLDTLPEPNYIYPVADHPLNELNEDDELESEDGVVTGVTIPVVRMSPYRYKVNNGVVFTDFKEGFINIAYKAYPVDNEGFLMIPDDEKLRAAVKYHLIYKIDYRAWRVNPASPGMKALLNDSEQRRDFYAGAARNKSHIPNVSKMESIKNRWLSLIPRINEHRNGFRTLNNQERRY